MNINLRQDAPDQTDNLNVNELSEAIEQFKSIGAQILASEIKTKELKEQERYLSEHVIPEIMEKQNLKTVKLKDGSELSIGKKFFASTKARNNGLGDIVDNNVTVTFGQGEDNKAMAYATLARESGYEPSQKESVHHSRLSAVMREWKENGKEIPADLFNVLDGNRTSITNKK
jgi:hypothetical protein